MAKNVRILYYSDENNIDTFLAQIDFEKKYSIYLGKTEVIPIGKNRDKDIKLPTDIKEILVNEIMTTK